MNTSGEDFLPVKHYNTPLENRLHEIIFSLNFQTYFQEKGADLKV
jgi:hypothetical protein